MKTCPRCKRRFVDTEDSCPLDDAPLSSATGELPAGLDRVLGSYRLVCQLGEGGMGTIYVGRHTALNRHVAIKVLRSSLASRKEAVARFFQEADTINRLHHPNIIESIDLVEDVVDGAYVVLELLRGPDLKTRLSEGPMSIESVLHVGAQIADALGAVHALGIVHRDLKPENLILIEGDRVKLIDFGIAQIGQQATGVAVGTAAYMAPEQAAGRPVDGRADVYSLGVLLFEMVTGRHPFPSQTDGEYLLRHAETPPPRPGKLAPRCPPALEQVILRCLAKDPDERYPDAATVASVLRAVDPRARQARGSGVFAGAMLALGAIGAGGYFFYTSRATSEPQAVAAAPSPPPVKVATPPAPTAAESPPVIVEIDVVSTPAGAKAYRVGETVPLGTTPFSVQLPRSDAPIEIRFEHPGYEPKQVEVPIAASMEIDVSLVKRKPVAVEHHAAPVSEKPKGKVSREGVMDPFAP
jgi:serine/threonine-protein kinase